VVDTSGYEIPYPSYTVTFEIPTATTVLFAVTIANSTSLPSNIISLVQNAVVAQFIGTNGSARARIGSLILAATYYAPIINIGPYVSVLSVLLGISSPTLTSQQMGIDQAPTCVPTNVSVILV
jgi:hypothetical protein